MQNVLLVIHLIACIALVIAIMLQRSEGGALGMGGGGTGGLISGRGAASVLVRTTMVLATIFFITSIAMTWLHAQEARAPTDLERQIQQQGATGFDLNSSQSASPPATTTPAPPASVDPLAPSAADAPSTSGEQPAESAPAPAEPSSPSPDPLAPPPNP